MEFSITPKTRYPIIASGAPPTPPAREVPPTTTALITIRGILSPYIADPVFSVDESKTPAKQSDKQPMSNENRPATRAIDD